MSLTCPKCKKTLTLDLRPSDPAVSTPTEEDNGFSFEQVAYEDPGDPNEDSAVDLYSDGVDLSLLIETEPGPFQHLKTVVEELGYKCVPAENSREAISKIRRHHFSLVILSDRFEGVEWTQSPVLRHLNHIPMSIRRGIYLVLVGDTFRTLDEMAAFALSADLVLNRKDLKRVASILKRAMTEKQRFYNAFMDAYADVGKA